MKPKILTIGKTIVNLMPTQTGITVKMKIDTVHQFESIRKYLISEGFFDDIPEDSVLFHGILTGGWDR